ncbi:MAG: hypothetical protein VX438_05075 [Planctomycetota bacterium]|nr:hypothetical protein [Planctomycetota bacterium]
MSDQYEYPCQCGATILVTANDAGRNLVCDTCQQSIQIPGLREIKNLTPHTQTSTGKLKESTWNFEKGIWFFLGGLAICLGLGVGIPCFLVGHYQFPYERPNVRGDWIATSERVPTVDYPVWAYAPNPLEGRRAYEYTIWDKSNQVWIFEDTKKQDQPREYFSKWGDSYLAAIETSVENSSIGDLWKFWYETEPKEPLKEWEEPIHAINWQFALTFYAFSGGGLVIALVGLFMIIHAVKKR